MLAVAAVESEPNDTKKTADAAAFVAGDPGLVLSGQIQSRKDSDFFRIEPEAGGPVQASVQTTGGLDAKVTIEDRFGCELWESESHDGVTAGSFELPAGEEVWVRVRGGSRGPAGGYELSLTLVDVSPSTPTPTNPASPFAGGNNMDPANLVVERESNNSKSTANPAPLGPDGIVSLQGTASNDRDQDFFAIRADQSGQLQVQLASTGLPAKLQVENRFGRKMLEIEQNDGQTSGAFNAVAGETYYFRLRSSGKLASAYLVDLALTS